MFNVNQRALPAVHLLLNKQQGTSSQPLSPPSSFEHPPPCNKLQQSKQYTPPSSLFDGRGEKVLGLKVQEVVYSESRYPGPGIPMKSARSEWYSDSVCVSVYKSTSSDGLKHC